MYIQINRVFLIRYFNVTLLLVVGKSIVSSVDVPSATFLQIYGLYKRKLENYVQVQYIISGKFKI